MKPRISIIFLMMVLMMPLRVSATIYSDLPSLKQSYQQGNPDLMKIVSLFESKAQAYMKMTPLTVTSKSQVPPSGDKRDYYSLSTYWWPDSTKKDGLPYIRRDGVVNPHIYDIPERKSMDKMSEAVECLCLLYYLTDKEAYAGKAASLLRTWFLDRKKGMNPNMTYAQLVPGHSELRGTGILDSRCLGNVLNASTLIENSKSWTSQDRAQLRQWAAAFCYWMENSTHGQKEHATKNNHGVWFDATHLMVLAYLGETNRIIEVTTNDLLPRLGMEIAEDGSLPNELVRTRSLHYSTFVLEAIAQANLVTSSVGINLWKSATPNGRKVISIVDNLYPYYLNPSIWPHPQIDTFNVKRAAPILYQAGMATGNKAYMAEAVKIGIKADETKYSVLHNYILVKTK